MSGPRVKPVLAPGRLTRGTLADYAERGGFAARLRPDRPLMAFRFREWLETARRGQAIEYHEGYLWVDRFPGGLLMDEEARRIDQVARAAWAAQEAGAVLLFSRRIGEARFSYIAVRTDVPATVMEAAA